MRIDDLLVRIIESLAEAVSPIISTVLTVAINNLSFNLIEHPELYESVREGQLTIVLIILSVITAVIVFSQVFDIEPIFKSRNHTILAVVTGIFSIPLYQLNWIIIDSLGTTRLIETPSEISTESIQLAIETGIQEFPAMVLVTIPPLILTSIIILVLSSLYITLIVTGAILIPLFAIQPTLKEQWNLESITHEITSITMTCIGAGIGVYASLQVISSRLVSAGSIELLTALSITPLIAILFALICENLYRYIKNLNPEIQIPKQEQPKISSEKQN